ncbi:hypothetical protein ACIQ4I_12400 [Rummeliibacillus sp. NPDC094406]|uniref:hypothetical protein n=1 Tax=Rummeliibacillus sp. NPDC094406 TaxID=3364511 RepID=UPI003813FFD2
MDKKYLVSLTMVDGQFLEILTDTDIMQLEPLPIPGTEMIVIDDNIMINMLKVEEIHILEKI